MPQHSSPAKHRLADYRPYPFCVTQLALSVELGAELTRVSAELSVQRKAETPAGTPLVLDGRGLGLDAISLDGKALEDSRYSLAADTLTLHEPPESFVLGTRVTLCPRANQGDEGLFELGGKLATQCESEGFRRITWFPDRPDVLSTFSVVLTGPIDVYPVMLSNGHPVARGELGDGRHWVRWEDPFPKPAYLFAIVAGDFGCLSDSYTTGSGRTIALNIYADSERIGECGFAMSALKRALAWEEDRYAREYDLDLYNIVALTGHVGAMENKGLNLFDANGICADPEISTDLDYQIVERILAHEVFHNWTGNRVTCRDWFQLSLKEGLPRFRDQCFSQDMFGAGVKRIEFVRALQRNQFPEDDGPACHPVKPEEYIEIRNFYTATVYDKGAEVIRMLHCLLGDGMFREAVMRYLQVFDLQAATTEDFVSTIEAVSGRNLSQFYRWYQQGGRPRVSARGDYDAATRRYTLTLRQHTAANAGQSDKGPFHIPVLMGLISEQGEPLQASSRQARQVDGNALLELTASEQHFEFDQVPCPPVPSLLRGFSAPVSLETQLTRAQLAMLWSRDTDAFNRWQSGQTLGIQVLRELAGNVHAGEPMTLDAVYADAWCGLLQDEACDPGLLAELLLLPDEPALSEGLPRMDIDGHAAARRHALRTLAAANRETLLARYQALADDGPYQFTAQAMGRRSLRNRCLEMLLADPDDESLELALAQINHGSNMTERFAALAALCEVDRPQRQQGIDMFYSQWQHKPSAIDKWFNAQALSRLPGAIDRFLALEQHPAMDIGNMPRAMAFYGGFFRQNRCGFHEPDGRAYQVLAERAIFIDAVKPGTTYWLLPQLLQWRRMDEGRAQKMRAALEAILAADISSGLYETVSKALAGESV